jgi:hypothetical protein
LVINHRFWHRTVWKVRFFLILKLTNDKWFRNLSEGKINILNQIYTLKVNENKRKLIYNKNNKLISTEAYKLKDGIIIN